MAAEKTVRRKIWYQSVAHWFSKFHFEFYLSIPLLSIQTRILTQAFDRMAYDVCRVRVKLYKWSFDFQLYKQQRY